ncbi:DUF2309 domain-containing protein [Maribacter litopenaei]|uniref:DUF2309 domain-containing protein n=1 Tax=Maribacter litopenaei TaxID=2976127 RepID=A0ABY5Y9X1_9FLAO|nr:DUF2309 domain-containing protein [Maribacter litopenaei]UWX55668.1 DUF2309 domain-containing protein [Maribacter litopenaei]
MNHSEIERLIEKASKYVGDTWPLYSFVTSNPLSGYEERHFFQAVKKAESLLEADMFPKASVYRKALERGEIDHFEIQKLLKKKGYAHTPEVSLELMATRTANKTGHKECALDQYMVKWLSSFLDEGLAEWQMPFKTEGFYMAWRYLAPYDDSLGKIGMNMIPKTSEEALEILLKGQSEETILMVLDQHLAALPGWTGYIKHRSEKLHAWQREAPIDLKDYLGR